MNKNEIEEEKVLIFIPSYNDNLSALKVAQEINNDLPKADILIVDDGSKEEIEINKFSPFYHYRLETNYGLGVCTHIAVDFMIAHNYSYLVRVDADGQHPVKEIIRMIDKLKLKNADCVVGSRQNHNDKKNDIVKNMVKKYYNLLSKLITQNKAPADVNSGFFAINLKSANLIKCQILERFPEPQIYILLCNSNMKMVEINIMQKERVTNRTTLTFFHALRMFYRFNIFLLTELIRSSRK
ncbi:glycosyltransferase family 2 protein [Pelagibacterales bacterium SAG-MED32]|nr:glycosyltransferase family 2 protein [Pelagibacterales bacterium SAG-MED32]